MADLRKTVRLAGELLTELQAQGQSEGDLGETLGQFLEESDELLITSNSPTTPEEPDPTDDEVREAFMEGFSASRMNRAAGGATQERLADAYVAARRERG